MAGKMPSTPMKFGRKLAEKAASRGPNPNDLTQGRMKLVGPARFAGTVSGSKGPVAPGDHQTPKVLHLPWKPVSSEKGQPSKKV